MKRMEHIELHPDYYRYSYRRVNSGPFAGYYHYHRGLEINYIHAGSGFVTIDQRLYELRPHMLLWYKPFQLHRIHVDSSDERPYTRTLLTFEPQVFDGFLAPYPRLQLLMHQLLAGDQYAQAIDFGEEPELLGVLFRHYAERMQTVQEYDRRHTVGLLITQLLDFILPRLQQDTDGSAGGTTRNPRYSERIMGWIEQRFSETFDLDALAADLHLSKHYVSRVFRQETGSSITEYLLNRRMREACRLLATTDWSVQAIGNRVGIFSFPHFCRIFKGVMNVTPREYRRKALE